jgi:hypothetical protein
MITNGTIQNGTAKAEDFAEGSVMATVYFTKRILRGVLTGCVLNESLNFVSVESASRWIAGVKANCRDWELVDYSFQKYWTA